MIPYAQATLILHFLGVASIGEIIMTIDVLVVGVDEYNTHSVYEVYK